MHPYTNGEKFGFLYVSKWGLIIYWFFFLGDVKEIRIIGGHLGPHCWPTAIEMIARNLLPLDEIITHKFPLQEFEKGIKMVVDSAQSIKVMLFHTNSTQ